MPERPPARDRLGPHLRATRRSMFVLQVAALGLGLAIAVPILSLATNAALAVNQRPRLSDADLLDFLLGTSFPLTLLLVLIPLAVIHTVGYAAQLVIAQQSFDRQPLSPLAAIRLVWQRLAPMALLSLQYFARLLLLALPFLALISGVIFWQLKRHGLDHYLRTRPPEFLLAVALCGLLLVAMIYLMIRRTTPWYLTLPLVIFAKETPASARRLSVAKTRRLQRGIRRTLVLWALITLGLSAALNAGWPFLADLVGTALGHRLGLISLVMSVLMLVSVTICLLVGFHGLTFLALHQVRLFRRLGLAPDRPAGHQEPLLDAPGRFLGATGIIAIAIATLGLSYHWLDSLRIADRARIIADQGSSSHAPENTLEAFRLAFEQGSHGIATTVRPSADGHLMLWADPTLARVTERSLTIAETPAQALKEIDVGSWFDDDFHDSRLLKLPQLLTLCDDVSLLLLELPADLKGAALDALAATLFDRLEEAGMAERAWLVCADPDQIDPLRALRAGWKIGLSHLPDFATPEVPLDFVLVPAHLLRAPEVIALHQDKIEVYVTDTRDPLLLSTAMTRGADGVIVRSPSLARKVILERAALNPGERLLLELLYRFRLLLRPFPSPSTP